MYQATMRNLRDALDNDWINISPYNVLIRSVCPEFEGFRPDQSVQEAGQPVGWTKVLAEAEKHGLGPLFYNHIKTAGVEIPAPFNRSLRALYLRHRRANQVRMGVLAEILAAYQTAGLQVLVLKGAALAHLIYPEPGLRPMRDIDLLVKKSEAAQAQRLLTGLGFAAPLPDEQTLPGKHLEAATLRTGGLCISVEIHHNLFNDDFPDSMTIDDLTGKPLSFTWDQVVAYTLSCEDMLWHLCRHAIHIHQPLRLIWIADIVGFAERYAAEIDWERIRRQYSGVLNTLRQFHFLIPLSETLRREAALQIGPPPQGVGLDFQGWPRYSIAQQQPKSRRRILSDTFFPSAWWLGLNYGLSNAYALAWYRWVGHPLHILGWAKQLLLERAKIYFSIYFDEALCKLD